MMLRLMLLSGGHRKAEYLKKKKLFRRQGEHCFFVPYNYGTEPYLLSFGNNVHVASGVRFVTHDVTAMMFHHMEPEADHTIRVGTIEVGDNVFIGVDATVLYDVKIGDNVIIAAGEVVNKDLPGGAVYAGVPAKKVGDFYEYMRRNQVYSEGVTWKDQDSLSEKKNRQIAFLYGEKTEM